VTGTLLKTFLRVTLLLASYAMAKPVVFLHATSWLSAAVTMACFGLSATIAVCCVLRKPSDLLVRSRTHAAAHQHLEADRASLATAIAQAADGIVITDTQARVQYVNPAFTRMTGYGLAEVIGQNPRILKSNRQDSTFYQHLWQTIRRRAPSARRPCRALNGRQDV
jgi:PAS domain-containing protein